MDFFTSDTHFGHKNIIKYCFRPFESAEEMDNCLIKNWNDVVRPSDRVFVIGDVFLCQPQKAKKYINSLNGYKILILGNHDRSPRTMMDCGFDECHYQYTYEMPDGSPILLQHYPIPELLYPDHKLLVHGHVHEEPKFRGKKINVCTDLWGYKPIPLSYIKNYMDSHKEKDSNEELTININNDMLEVSMRVAMDDYQGLSKHINDNINEYKRKSRDNK